MLRTTILTMVDGVRVVVPDSLDLITPYVLREQEDWFEDEIKFLRRLLQPGDNVIDIGANYGVYTLSMARTVGAEGRLWSFEPASRTANLLADGIAANGFTHVNLERSALSSRPGTAQLALNENSELNALVRGETPPEASETVAVVTLDDCMQRYGWRDIDLVKIDAEGEEANILEGGERFLAELSPLIQYEVKAGEEVHLELVRAFARRGYESYRLVPGLDLLAPFEMESLADAYLLNLFCCKPDRAAQLAARGLLVEAGAADDHGRVLEHWIPHLSIGTGSHNRYGWRHALAKLPYGAHLAPLWERTVAAGGSAEVEKALFLHALSRDSSLTPAERFVALEASFEKLEELCAGNSSHLRLSSLARATRDYGARALAVDALARLNNVIARNQRVDAGEPFLAPGERFDSVPPRNAIGDWVLAAVLEEFERLGSFSSFYSGASARPRLEAIDNLRFGGAEMQRRSSLLQQRFGPAPTGHA